MASRVFHPAFFLALFLACGAGCSKGKKGPQFELTPVSGSVTLDGQPLANADIGFAYQGAAPQGFYGSAGRTDSQGHYELQTGDRKGGMPGTYNVTVSRMEAPDGTVLDPQNGMDMGQLGAAGGLRQTVPAKYTDATTTELSATVEKGKSDGYNFDLKSG